MSRRWIRRIGALLAASLLLAVVGGVVGIVVDAVRGDPVPVEATATPEARALAARVRQVLVDSATEGPALLGGIAPAELAQAQFRCPTVVEPAAGDSATCRVRAGAEAEEWEVVIEFAADGSFTVVSAAPAP